MQFFLTWLLRLIMLGVALVFAASLALALVIMIVGWALGAAWARLTGQRVTPFIMRIDPRAGFDGVYRRPRQRRESAPADAPPRRPEPGDVTDVEPRPPSN